MKKRHHFLISLTSLFSWIILITAAILVTAVLSIVHYESNTVAIDSARALFKEISAKTTAQVDIVLKSITILADTAAPAFEAASPLDMPTLFHQDLTPMKAILDSNPVLMSVYVGYDSGAFHQLIAMRDNAYLRANYLAPDTTVYIERTISLVGTHGFQEEWRYLDGSLLELGERKSSDIRYDPRKRPWYQAALKSERSVFTAPYIFSSSRLPGLTCARELLDGGGVCGFDLTLAQLSETLAKQDNVSDGIIWIQTADGKLVAYPELAWQSLGGDGLKLPLVAESSDKIVRSVSGEIEELRHSKIRSMFFFDVGSEVYLADYDSIVHNGLDWKVVIAVPVNSITGYIGRMVLRIILISLGVLLLIAPLTIVIVFRGSKSVRQLVEEAKKIKNFDFSPSKPVRTILSEVQELATSCEVMKNTIQSKTEDLIRTQQKLDMLVQNGLALSAEKTMDRLVTQIFQTAVSLANADGGVMYLLEGNELGVELLSLGKAEFMFGGLFDKPAPSVTVQPGKILSLSPESVLYAACEAFNSQKMVTVRDKNLELFPTGLSEEPAGFAIHSLIAVPIVTRQDEVLGVIQLFNPRKDANAAAEEDWGRKTGSFVASLAAQAAVTLDNRNLVDSLHELFDALIKVLATSIDAKSSYTAGHCSRVPELAVMLAEAAHATDTGPVSDFFLQDDDAWRQLWLAAWLHDCGKVTTPEFVVDKATKLEAPYNRIHEIRMRFEVLRRDAEIEYYQRLAENNGSDPSALHRKLDAKLEQLDEDFLFIASCNLGAEFMDPEAMERLEQLAQCEWKRYFSDRLGISFEELKRKEDSDELQLPVTEKLLSDKYEHLVPRMTDYSGIKDAKGIPIAVPDYDYNRGEVYNLSIKRGTLTPEERFKINEHTLSGLKMLKQIPFPQNLARVTDIACSHHETLIGTGYPLQKTKEQLLPEARILAIADIFEALTASDRPYKEAKTVSEALRIMSIMRNQQHIDADFFAVFLTQGVYLKYAEKFLNASKIDVVDISQYL